MEEPKPPENRNINTGGGNYNERIEGDYIQGNVFQNIFNTFSGQTTTPVGNPARPKNERLLLAAVKEEVTARLRQSLHNAVLINLGKELQPQQVKLHRGRENKTGEKPPQPLADTTSILEVFDDNVIAGKLLILGEPGSGKTTTQLELAQALIKRAEEQPDYPVPVLFNLSSWKDDCQSLTDWVVAELKSKYAVPTLLGQEWINNHQLLLLLDGLDELEPNRQEYCVQLINQFFSSENKPRYLVVCSRSEEYGNFSAKLQLNGAIYLKLLTVNQIQNYLIKIKINSALFQAISDDIELLNLVKTPLFLSISVIAFPQISIEYWQQLTSTKERIQHLFDAYWEQQMFKREYSKEFYTVKKQFHYFLDKYIRRWPVEPDNERYIQQKPPTPEQTRHWLVWLAKQMQQKSKTEFLIEQMQPSWLQDKLKNIYKLRVKLLFGITIGLGLGLFLGLIFKLLLGQFLWVGTGLSIGLTIACKVGNLSSG